MACKNQFDKAVELLKLVICRRRIEIQKETPKVDAAEAPKRTIKDLIDAGVEIGRLKEPEKRRQRRLQDEEDDDEMMTEDETKDMIEAIVSKFLEEQESADEENTLKIEI